MLICLLGISASIMLLLVAAASPNIYLDLSPTPMCPLTDTNVTSYQCQCDLSLTPTSHDANMLWLAVAVSPAIYLDLLPTTM